MSAASVPGRTTRLYSKPPASAKIKLAAALEDHGRLAGEGLLALAGGGIPDHQVVAVVAGRDAPAVGGPRGRADGRRVTLQSEQLLAGRHVPDARRLALHVFAGRD